MSDSQELLKSPLHERHVAGGTKMAPAAGWDMPLSYRGALEECEEVRRRAGVLDVSHFGRFRVRGDGALDLLERVCTTDVARQEFDTAAATLLCNERGGIIDAARLVRLEDSWLLVTSPDARQRVAEHLAGENVFDAKIDDQTAKTAQLLVAGPSAGELLDAVLPEKVASLPPGAARTGSLLIAKYVAWRGNELGDFSLEVSLPAMAAGLAWDFVTRKAGERAIPPAGLAAWDVLRIEAGLVRFGHEFNETIDPVSAGLADRIDGSRDFLGAKALTELRGKSPARIRVGLSLQKSSPSPTIPRQGAMIFRADGTETGTVTSGTYSPTLGSALAMAYVAAQDSPVGTELFVECGNEKIPASVAALPFFRR
jgi:aminomethyltransferase